MGRTLPFERNGQSVGRLGEGHRPRTSEFRTNLPTSPQNLVGAWLASEGVHSANIDIADTPLSLASHAPTGFVQVQEIASLQDEL
jgi:hypothetical protein